LGNFKRITPRKAGPTSTELLIESRRERKF
jgi:hypothetical protein